MSSESVISTYSDNKTKQSIFTVERKTTTSIMILFIALMSLWLSEASAQKYSVMSFRLLPNDVSAFISPVTDLNGDDCALIKIQASEDFVFSTPLGIVKRIDKTGEIWLYVPKGTKKITLKHAEWGVLRDYLLPVRIDSHMTYEMILDEPERVRIPMIVETVTDTIVETVRDTLVVTHTDTLLIAKPRQRVPFSLTATLGATFGGRSNTLAAGIMVAAMRRHGCWIHVVSDFGKPGHTVASCDRHGVIDGATPYFTGKTRHYLLLAAAGAIHRVSSSVAIFEGIGYGNDHTSWERSASDGGGYVRNSYYSRSGILFELGTLVSVRNIALSLSVSSIKGLSWYGSVGIGYKF